MWTRSLIVGFCGLVLVLGIGHPEMYRNEGLRASLAAEAMRDGDWLVPHLHGEPHLTKPPGMAVLIALCSLPFGGVTPVSARLPSVLAGAAFIALFGWTVGRRFGAGAGWLAAVLMPSCPLWLDRVPSAEIDLVQLAWVGGSLVCLLHAAEDDSMLWWLAAMACVAGGLFTKWTTPIFFYLTAVPWLWQQGKLRLLVHRGHLLGLLLVAALAIGWLGAVARSVGWDVLLDTLSREALLRFSPAHHPRPYPWDELLTFPLGFLAGCLPCSLALVVAFRPRFALSWDESQRAFLRLCQVWLVTALVFWTLAPGHRPRHILPAQPAVVGLAVLVALRLSLSPARRRVLLGVVLVGWLAVKVAFVGWVVPARQAGRHPTRGAAVLARKVPPQEILYVAYLKDDGLLFHYGRPVRRLRKDAASGAWCLLTRDEWAARPHEGVEVVAWLLDGQGKLLVLVRVR
jgi:4-amino-4-deoxy-L-arabinose transferase-like glycosyltransferase